MKISTKGRYGVRIMLELALHYNRRLLTVKNIAHTQNLSEKYIEQIIGSFNKAGLVRSQRGASGGYRLASAPQEITVGQILRVTEGGLEIVDCDGTQPCIRRKECVTAEVWKEIRETVEAVVDKVTLENLVDRYHEKCNYNYII